MYVTTQLDSVLEEIRSRWGIPGLAVGIVENDEIVYARGFGVQSLKTGIPVTPSSIFCVASIAKCFVASAIMQLIEQGKVHLDSPLVEYLPYFRLDDVRCTQITIRQILSHTSGMPDMEETEYDTLVSYPEYDEGASERYVRSLSSRKMFAAPGERFWYSNIAYNVLGDLIAKISGRTFEKYMHENILRPAGMTESTFLPAKLDQSRLAVPHLRTPQIIVNPIYPYHRADAPASFLHSTVLDMCHWSMTCLNQGIFNGRRILSPASFELMWTPVVKRKSTSSFFEHHGLGWILGHFEGVKTVSHGGGGFGWTCFLLMMPEKNRGSIILCNEESTARERMIEAVARTMLDQEPQAGSVSWLVPISQAIQGGGIRAAYDCYSKLKNRAGEDVTFDEYDMVSLAYQLMGAQKLDHAMEVLQLNIHAFPQYMESYTLLANFYHLKGESEHAKNLLKRALILKPGDTAVAEKLKMIEMETEKE